MIAALARPPGPLRRGSQGHRPDVTDGTGVRLTLRHRASNCAADQVVLAPGPWLAEPAWRDLVSPARPAGQEDRRDAPRAPADPGRRADHLRRRGRLPAAGHPSRALAAQLHPDRVGRRPRRDPPNGLSPGDVEAARATLRPLLPRAGRRLRLRPGVLRRLQPEPANRSSPTLDGTDGRVVFAGAANGSGYRLAPAIASEAVDLLYIDNSNPDSPRTGWWAGVAGSGSNR